MNVKNMEKIAVVYSNRSDIEIILEVLRQKFLIVVYHSFEKFWKEGSLKDFSCVCIDTVFLNDKTPKILESIIISFKKNNVPVIMLSKERSKELEYKFLMVGTFDYLTFPLNIESCKTRIEKSILVRGHNNLVQKMFDLRLFELEKLQHNVIKLLYFFSESKGPERACHLKRLQNYSLAIGNALKQNKRYANILSDNFLKCLYTLIPIHDIGTVVLPDHVVKNYTNNTITSAEIKIMESHTIKGGLIIKQISDGIEENFFLEIAYDLTQSHHEYWNGTGYPEGLSGNNIPLAAQILRIAEEYNVRVQKEAYRTNYNQRPVINHREAIDFIIEQRGKLFSEDLVNAFYSVESIIEAIAEKYQENYVVGLHNTREKNYLNNYRDIPIF